MDDDDEPEQIIASGPVAERDLIVAELERCFRESADILPPRFGRAVEAFDALSVEDYERSQAFFLLGQIAAVSLLYEGQRRPVSLASDQMGYEFTEATLAVLFWDWRQSLARGESLSFKDDEDDESFLRGFSDCSAKLERWSGEVRPLFEAKARYESFCVGCNPADPQRWISSTRPYCKPCREIDMGLPLHERHGHFEGEVGGVAGALGLLLRSITTKEPARPKKGGRVQKFVVSNFVANWAVPDPLPDFVEPRFVFTPGMRIRNKSNIE